MMDKVQVETDAPEMVDMIERRTWEDFRKTGLLWFANTILHAFGWAIVVELEKGKLIDAYPARVCFRGFDEATNTTGYRKVAHYMAKEAEKLVEEADD